MKRLYAQEIIQSVINKAYDENIRSRNWDITDVNRYYAMVNALERSQYKLGLFYNPFTKSFERWK